MLLDGVVSPVVVMTRCLSYGSLTVDIVAFTCDATEGMMMAMVLLLVEAARTGTGVYGWLRHLAW